MRAPEPPFCCLAMRRSPGRGLVLALCVSEGPAGDPQHACRWELGKRGTNDYAVRSRSAGMQVSPACCLRVCPHLRSVRSWAVSWTTRLTFGGVLLGSARVFFARFDRETAGVRI